MTTTKTQMRGNCQRCGADQAVLSTGFMAKHGYTVKGGWFNGVCSGQHFLPLQTQRTETDRMVASVREDCEDLEAQARMMEQGKIDPATAGQRWNIETRAYDDVPYAEGTSWDQKEARKSAVWKLNQRAAIGKSFADGMTRLADERHGTPLRVVTVDGPPPAILRGERRQGGSGVLECSGVDKGRVYWKNDEQKRKGWIGTRAWRNLPVAA